MDRHTLNKKLSAIWKELFGDFREELLENFIDELDRFKKDNNIPPLEDKWYKDAIVYSLYVDLFNTDFTGLEEKLPYLADLGVNCLWLLPILESPMKDDGFDISRYDRVRRSLLGLSEEASDEEREQRFRQFLQKAHEYGLQVIFDIAMNHTSDQHQWFRESRKSPDNPYRDYYIWNKDKNKYIETRLLFKGMVNSNWEKDGDWYYFHRFFEFQPDLNYRNPHVLLEMSRILMFWLSQGVDGFRADAIPYLWKEEGTDCENLPQTHSIVKFFRAVTDYLRPHTLLLAEACQPPKEVVKYFGEGDECHGGYHFPLMPQIFNALAVGKAEPIMKVLSPEVTPEIRPENQWFTFLRLHDELTLEMVSEEDRKIIHDHYCRDPRWDFREGEGVAARLSELLEFDERKYGLAYSIMMTLPGTPMVYYGDEFGKPNDEAYFEKKAQETGYKDSRYLVRGEIDWDLWEKELQKPDSFHTAVNHIVKNMLAVRKATTVFGRGSIEWLEILDPEDNKLDSVLAFIREHNERQIIVIHNLSGKQQMTNLNVNYLTQEKSDMLGQNIPTNDDGNLRLDPYAYLWIELKAN
ncbi:MAG: alpha-glucosidase C-terminal domain-containing protein [Bacteroidales bacterium]|nr:alpha-glucosidase C-terminal domain-containing protein [Bacteroidales bacterium]MCF8339085.1 alpha-glucosidase C-terminal domain-containing protein [Bacteroidales bacterium]